MEVFMDHANLHFKSNVNGIININGTFGDYIDNENKFSLDIIANSNKLFITYIPSDDKIKYLTTNFALSNITSIPSTDCVDVAIVPFPDNHYDVIMNPYIYKNFEGTTPLYFSDLGKGLNIAVYNSHCSSIVIFEGDEIKYEDCTALLKKVMCNKKDNYIVIKGECIDNRFYLAIIDASDFSVAFNGICDSIDEQEEQIRAIVSTMDTMNHGIVYSVNCLTKQTDKYLVNTKKAKLPKCKHVVPMYFLECIKIGDIKSCKNMLDDNLKNVDDNVIKSYFGNIQNIYFNSHNLGYKVNYTIKNETGYKNYNFILNNNKISEIQEVF